MNFFQYLDYQYTQDKRAFIVHYQALGGKTRFAQHACQQRPDLYYLDLLEYFLAHPDLPPVRSFDGKALQNLLLHLAYSPGVYTVLVDHADFLFNTWSSAEKNAWIEWLRNTLRTPAVTKMTFVFFIQTDGVLSAANLANARGSRVLALPEFDAL